MKKALLNILFLTFLISSIFSCGTKEGKLPTVRLITTASDIHNNSINASVWKGFLDFYGDTAENQQHKGKFYDITSCQSQDLYKSTLEQLITEEHDLIITTEVVFADIINDIADKYPTQNFMLMDTNKNAINKPNVQVHNYNEEQGAFLIGAFAALKSIDDEIENPKFGFIGGVTCKTVLEFEAGYIQGLRHVIPNLPDENILTYYANDWNTPEKARTQAKNWFDYGIYTIFSVADKTGDGTITQAKEYRKVGKNVWAIGVNGDQHEDGIYEANKSAVLTSMIKKADTIVINALHNTKYNTFTGSITEENVATDGVGYAITNKTEISDTIIKKMHDIKMYISNGDIIVYSTYEQGVNQ